MWEKYFDFCDYFTLIRVMRSINRTTHITCWSIQATQQVRNRKLRHRSTASQNLFLLFQLDETELLSEYFIKLGHMSWVNRFEIFVSLRYFCLKRCCFILSMDQQKFQLIYHLKQIALNKQICICLNRSSKSLLINLGHKGCRKRV